jgi:ABC-type glycerol-3-phosphate transport system permease component
MPEPDTPDAVPEPFQIAPQQPGPRYAGSLLKGTLLGFGLNIGGMMLAGFAGALSADSIGVAFFAIVFGIGLGQLLWMIPFYRRFRRDGQTETAKGLVIAAAITFLLNASCWGLLMGGNFRFAG